MAGLRALAGRVGLAPAGAAPVAPRDLRPQWAGPRGRMAPLGAQPEAARGQAPAPEPEPGLERGSGPGRERGPALPELLALPASEIRDGDDGGNDDPALKPPQI